MFSFGGERKIVGRRMGAIASLHFFRLTEDGVRCDERGCFVGGVALLRLPTVDQMWSARAPQELEAELSELYGWPIDVAANRGGLAVVAGALQRNDLALAKIAALLLRWPAPPTLAKDRGRLDLGEQLFECGLLKGSWDPGKHPRTGEPPNRGRFAPKPATPATVPRRPSGSWPGLGDVVRTAMRTARSLLKAAAEKSLTVAKVAMWADPELRASIVAIIDALEALEPTELNANEQRAIDQVRAATDPPKPLADLQQPPTENALGYEQHHIVEQNRDNVAKSPVAILVEKFGRDVIDDPENLVWVPRLQHERITALYNSKAPGDPLNRLYREVVNAMDYQAQRAAGLSALRQLGVLQ